MYAAETTHRHIRIGLYLASEGGPLRWRLEWLDGPPHARANVLRLGAWVLDGASIDASIAWAWRMANLVRGALFDAGIRQVDILHTHGAPPAYDWRTHERTAAHRLYRRAYMPTTAAELRAIGRLPRRDRRLALRHVAARKEAKERRTRWL